MHRVLSQSSAKLLDSKLLSTALSLQRVILVTSFFANEVNDFLLFTLGHLVFFFEERVVMLWEA